MQITININNIDTTITLTPEQVKQITEANRPKLFDYGRGSYQILKDNVDIEYYNPDECSIKYGRYRRTKEQAEMDFKRQTRMMRLSALAWEVGECVEFTLGEKNHFVCLDIDEQTWMIDCASYYNNQTIVYMTHETATKVCHILNSGEYSLDIE